MIHAREQADRRLREREERYRQLFESANDALLVFHLDVRGLPERFLEVNELACRLLGYSREELLRMYPLELDSPLGPADPTWIAHHLSSRERIRFERVLRVRDGRWVPVEVSSNLFDLHGRPTVLAVIRDISERKQSELDRSRLLEQEQHARAAAEAAQAELEQVFERMTDAVAVFDEQWRPTYLNTNAERLFGRRRVELLGRGFWDVYPELVKSELSRASFQVLHDRKPCEFEEFFEVFGAWCEVRLYPMPDGVSAFFRDVSEKKRAEDEEQRLQEELRRNETLSTLGSLVAGVAHEVRNPLFGITATLDALEARFGNGAVHDHLPVLREGVGRLNGLMKDLLEYGRPPELRRAPGSIGEIVGEACRALAGQAGAAGVELRARVAEGLPQVEMDRGRILQVFQNLIENAIQHLAPGGEVVVEAELLEERGRAGVVCRVSDTGPGFAPDDLLRVFQPLYSRRPGGTGLGLSIVKQIVERHGGSVDAGNRPEGGAAVTVRLPAMGTEWQRGSPRPA